MKMHSLCQFGILLSFATCAFSAGVPVNSPRASSSKLSFPANAAAAKDGQRRLSRTALYFEPNVGQADPSVRYIARGGGFMTMLTGDGAVFVNLHTREPVRLQFRGASSRARIVPSEPLRGVSNYFIGRDPSKWRTDVPHYSRLLVENVYENIDLAFYSKEGRLEYDFIVKPGADPSRIELAWKGIHGVTLDKDGDMVVSTSAGDIRHKRPVVYQLVGGKQVPVEASYRSAGRDRFSIRVPGYDKRLALVIDPTIFYSTYFGANGQDDITALVLDPIGSACIAGFTTSTDLPLAPTVPAQGFQGRGDAFITKIGPGGDEILFSTYIGGSEDVDRAQGIALDSIGDVYITGFTSSFGFPTTPNAYQKDFSGTQDAFILKLSGAGNSILWATYIGGIDTYEQGLLIAIDPSGNVVVSGTTTGTLYPTTPGAYSRTYVNGSDAFLSKFDSRGRELLFSTLFGGNFEDTPSGMALDPAGNVYLTGTTNSFDFPTTPGAYRRTLAGQADVFIMKFSLDCKRLLFSTLIGSTGVDSGGSISIEPGGRIAIAGGAGAADFPTTTGAYRTIFQGLADGFVARFNSDCSVLIASTLIGSSGFDVATAATVQEGGALTVLGYTESNNFPVTPDAFAFSVNFFGDAFITSLSPLANSLRFSSILGGSNPDLSRVMAARGDEIIVGGVTSSNNFPITANSISKTIKGGSDGFLTRIVGIGNQECLTTVTPTITSYTSGAGGGGIAIGEGCAWNAFSTAPWISLDPANAAFLTGAGSLNYRVVANPNSEPRAGAIYAGGNLVPIIQKGTANTQIFSDVLPSDTFADFIRIIRNQGVTTGCGGNNYCPNDFVTRATMAVFLIRGMIGSDDFPFPTTPYFSDIPANHAQFKWIQKIRELGITSGCGGGQFCPNDIVTRGQMATFLVRARYGGTFTASSTAYFTDVPLFHTFFQYVQKLKSTGITTGCGGNVFCVNDNITRGQMAVFLTRAFFTPW